MVQKSILSFFSSPNLKKDSDTTEESRKSEDKPIINDSPIKVSNKRRLQTIESDSEDEDNTISNKTAESDHEMSEEPSTSVMQSNIKENYMDISEPSCSVEPEGTKENEMSEPSNASSKVFESIGVPPLRKTARKQIKRKSGCLEDKQIEVIKRLKGENDSKPVTEKLEKLSIKDKLNCFSAKNNENRMIHPFFHSKSNLGNVDIVVKSQKHLSSDECVKEKENKSPKKEVTLSNKSVKEEITKSPTKDDVNEDSLNNGHDDLQANSPQVKNETPKKDTHQKKDNSPEKSPIKEISPSIPEKKNPFAAFGKQSKPTNIIYKPDKNNYHPIDDAFWKKGADVPYLALSKTLQTIEETSGRLKMIQILSNFYRSVIVLSPHDFIMCIYLCLNKVAPAFEGLELKIGDMYLIKAIAQSTGRTFGKIKKDAVELGDIGIVAQQSKSNQKLMCQGSIRPLTIQGVFKQLKEISLMSGHSSQMKKVDKIKGMLVACRESEARFLIRSLAGKLRIGLAEQSVLQAIAQACFLTPPERNISESVLNVGQNMNAETIKSKIDEVALILKTAYCECPTFEKVIPNLLEHGVHNLPKYCKLEPGIPLKPMLAHPTKGIGEVFKRFDKADFTCEFKYDGERAQIHLKDDGTISIFSRNQENNTTKYPDIISGLKQCISDNVKSCILDTESVAYDCTEDKILPFQILSTRKRKDANEEDIKVQVCVFLFDLLYLNGENLVKLPFKKRRHLLRENFQEIKTKFIFAKSIDSDNTEDIEEFLEESIKGNCEGLMVKTLNVEATYEIAKRSRNWLKLKKDYLDGVGDTIDVVVIGGYSGMGKRAGCYGGFLLACYDVDNEEFQSLCKIGTGFSHESLQEHTKFFKNHVIEKAKSYYSYDTSLEPDFWFDAVQVWEIKCADLSISPVYKAAIGIVDSEKGISLRFPRFLRIRDDKSVEDATSACQIAEMYKNQDQIKNQNAPTNVEEDYY